MVDGKPPPETCRASYRNKLRKVASCWLYSTNLLAMHGHMNVLCIVAGEMKADLCENSQYLYAVETDVHSTI